MKFLSLLVDILNNLKKSPKRIYTEKTVRIKTELVNGLIQSIELEFKEDLTSALQIKEQIFQLLKPKLTESDSMNSTANTA